ncbi:MAG TPA: hypothetical protein VFA26_17885 [Gemmataceae bacterium]|nr:hypothetical protein [Gemmataceae bacterium]
MRERRTVVWIDRFQSRLVLRLGLYWLVYQLALWNFLFVWRLLEEGKGDPVEQYGRFFRDFYPMLLCFLIVAPFFAWDALRFAHRVVGPLYRFRRTVQALAAGQPVRRVQLRDGDYLVEMRDDLNALLDALERQGVIRVLGPAVPPNEEPAAAPAPEALGGQTP